jgi:hypothetical protein
MKLRTKILLISSIPFLCFFAFGITEMGQEILRGKISPGIDHGTLDDIYMGAGLAPWVYGFVPFIFLCGSGMLSWILDLFKQLKSVSNADS